MQRKANAIGLPEGTKVPNHIALVLDGNRRWARARGLNPWEGHKAGVEAVREVVRASRGLGVHTFTIWAFSTENWDRSKLEIDEIMELLVEMIAEARKEAVKEGVRIIHLGRKDRLPENVLKALADVEAATKACSRHVFNWALDYGGKDEIVRATNRILQSGIRSVDEKTFERYLDTGGQPYPYVDLFIRTSGEQRTSGLLPWQMTYAEMYWELDHLPDFTPEKLKSAILDYSRRRRRFGGNDAEEHLKFDPKLVARLEMDWREHLTTEKVIKYVKEQYGLSKELAKTAGVHLASALVHRNRSEWAEAKTALKNLYVIVKTNLGLAFEPELIANLEVNLWNPPSHEATEGQWREFLGEKYRFSDLQAAKSAHLAVLANKEPDQAKARGYLEKFYQALKERVA